MKVIMLMFDSLNRHLLEPYGCSWTKTPNFRRLAEHSVTFDRCYVGSLPCMPARRELHTGRYNFLHRSWGPLEPFDDSMPEMLGQKGIYTHLITDHYHYWEDGGATYHQRYHTWEIVRGQEGDNWKASVAEPDIPEYVGQIRRQDLVNRAYIRQEEDFPQSEVFRLGFEFLDKNRDQDNWFLQLEAFDPHEPYFMPEKYKELYPHSYDGPEFDWPPYAKVTQTEEQVEHCRYEYASLLSMCDANLGRLLDYLDRYEMWKDTMLIVNTDHGFLLGEHDLWAKNVHPCYEENAHIPLFIWDPRCKKAGERRKSLVQTIDLVPTVLGSYGVAPTKDMQGRDLRDTIEQDKPVRDFALFGMHGVQVNITDGRYVYMRGWDEENTPLYNYTLIPTHMRSFFSREELETIQLCEGFSFTKGLPVLKTDAAAGELRHYAGKIQMPTRLYDLQSDPEQLHPIEDEKTEEYMKAAMTVLMQESEAPLEQYERLGLS